MFQITPNMNEMDDYLNDENPREKPKEVVEEEEKMVIGFEPEKQKKEKRLSKKQLKAQAKAERKSKKQKK